MENLLFSGVPILKHIRVSATENRKKNRGVQPAPKEGERAMLENRNSQFLLPASNRAQLFKALLA